MKGILLGSVGTDFLVTSPLSAPWSKSSSAVELADAVYGPEPVNRVWEPLIPPEELPTVLVDIRH